MLFHSVSLIGLNHFCSPELLIPLFPTHGTCWMNCTLTNPQTFVISFCSVVS